MTFACAIQTKKAPILLEHGAVLVPWEPRGSVPKFTNRSRRMNFAPYIGSQTIRLSASHGSRMALPHHKDGAPMPRDGAPTAQGWRSRGPKMALPRHKVRSIFRHIHPFTSCECRPCGVRAPTLWHRRAKLGPWLADERTVCALIDPQN